MWLHQPFFQRKSIISSEEIRNLSVGFLGREPGGGKCRLLFSRTFPNSDSAKTPPSAFLPELPISTKVNRYLATQTAIRTMLCVPNKINKKYPNKVQLILIRFQEGWMGLDSTITCVL